MRMGRNKIDIIKINDISKRKVTFKKRLEGLLKKIYEISVLTDAEFVFAIKDEFTNVYRFMNASEDLVHVSTGALLSNLFPIANYFLFLLVSQRCWLSLSA